MRRGVRGMTWARRRAGSQGPKRKEKDRVFQVRNRKEGVLLAGFPRKDRRKYGAGLEKIPKGRTPPEEPAARGSLSTHEASEKKSPGEPRTCEKEL